MCSSLSWWLRWITYSYFPSTKSLRFIGFLVYIGLIIEFLIALVIGLMAWRMVVVGTQVWRLGRKFDVNPQLAHPDACGGLEPLGNLCLWNALIVSMAEVFLGGWLVIGPSTAPAYRSLAAVYAPLFSKLLVVPMVTAVISFLLPLWSVHQIMATKRAQLRWQLDQLGQRINDTAYSS